jgi:hypothetical protein
MRRLIFPAVLIAAGCASQTTAPPPPPVASAPSAAPAGAAASAPTTPVAYATSGAAAAGSDPHTQQVDDAVKKALKSGYRVTVKNDAKSYCRDQASVGSRFSKTYCYTADELVDVFQRQQQLHDDLSHAGNCGSPACSMSK